MFNTFPTQSRGEAASETASSSEPILKNSALPSYYGAGSFRTLEGYASIPGSAIQLPSSSGTSLVCVDSTGSTIYSYIPSSLITGYDFWVGFWMNEDATLLYLVVRDQSASPDQYALATIDSSGTVSTIGADQPSSDFANQPAWSANSLLTHQGDGGFMIASFSEFAIIDSSGQFTTQPTYSIDLDYTMSFPFVSDDGFTINSVGGDGNSFEGFNISLFQISKSGRRCQYSTSSSNALGLNSNINSGVMRWKDYIVVFDHIDAGNIRTALVKYSIADFNKYISDLAKYLGVTE